ncbi:MAG TPA: hypothetical protein VER96_37810 [Polyangiaceae bacterium]|nr:hypothetical protein [Polyangiaceae bacterium]
MSIRSLHLTHLGLLVTIGVVASIVGCSGSDAASPNPNPGTGGRSSASGGSANGGSPGSAGSTATQSGGSSSLGGSAPASGGSGPSAGGSGPSAGGNGSGGRAVGGSGNSSGGQPGSAGGGSTAAQPSAGCSMKTPRPSGGTVTVANTSIYKFPESYDGSKPFPLLIALHACGNPNTEFVSITDNTDFGTGYVRAFPNTPDSGQCWSNYAGDVARVIAQYDELMSKYCIDQSRVFATAHSSGAQLLVNILSHKADAQHLNLKGIAPVAADPYNVAVPMPVLYIDGVMDNQRSADSAKNTVAKFRASNSCMDTSKPYSAIMTCNSTESGHPMVNPGCNIYDGCSVPTIWCAHNDPAYSGTQHGIPCFAIKSMIDFFAGL